MSEKRFMAGAVSGGAVGFAAGSLGLLFLLASLSDGSNGNRYESFGTTEIDWLLDSSIDAGLNSSMMQRLQQDIITEDQYSAIMLQSRSLSLSRPDELVEDLLESNKDNNSLVLGMHYGYPAMQTYMQYLSPTLYDLDYRMGPDCLVAYENLPETVRSLDCDRDGNVIAIYYNPDEDGLRQYVYIDWHVHQEIISYEYVQEDRDNPESISFSDLGEEELATLRAEIGYIQNVVDQSKEDFRTEFQQAWPQIEEELSRWGYVPDAVFEEEPAQIIYMPYEGGP